ncbi:proton-conducting transporter membrane subunit [Clostridium paraputrificum]|uniref:proton-conducting transporter transmembrane domain-containing protein n=1 Tax=Clostridium paraputrificum TaxID=29363 RepID=UPI00325B51A2
MSNDYSGYPLIAILTPFVLAFIIGLFKEKYIKIKKAIVVLGCIASFIITVLLIKPVFLDGKIITYWLGNWKPVDNIAIGIGMEVDALSLFVGLIITAACALSSIYSIKYMSKDDGLGKYYTLFLLLAGSMIGFVFTGDLFNMYVMLEIMTFAAIALTAFRTQKDKALEAGFKYLVIGGLGSSLILMGTALIYAQTHTLNIAQIALELNSGGDKFTPVTILALALLLVGYAVKSFMVPCHTWPPDAHMSAPSSISMLLSGVMSKTGVYGLIRILFMIFMVSGNKALAYLVMIWGAITMVVGVSMALLQTDFKRLLAFHSVSQLGYVITGIGVGLTAADGIANLGLMGGLYHMVNHASFKCLLFLCAGAVLYRMGTTDLNKVSGLGKKMPFTAVMFFIGAAAISGIPPFNGFASKWILYQSTSETQIPIITIVELIVSVLTLASFIKVGHSVFFGAEREELKEVKEIPFTMKLPMGILALICFVFGICSNYVIKGILVPIVEAIRNVHKYIDNMLLGDLSLLHLENYTKSDLDFAFRGEYNPESFLILFFIGVIAIIVAMTFGIHKLGKCRVESSSLEGAMDTKYEVFTGGEKEEFSKVGPHDLFWGMKHDFKGYFNRLSNAHSGVVNDYALWVVVTMAVIIIYCFITL